MERKNKRVLLGILIVSFIVAIISISYAFINIRLVGEKKQVLSAGELSLELEEDENNLTIENALPLYDEVGMIQSPFTFRVVNNSSVSLSYIVRLVDITTVEKLDTSIVKYGLIKDETDTIDFLSNLDNNQIDSGIISNKQTIHYALRLWLDSGVEDETLIKNKSLSYKIEIVAGQIDGTERNIVLDSAGGTLDTTSKSIVIGEMYGELPTPTKTGYNFLGWFNERDEVIHEDSILDSFTKKLTAKWGVNQYIVTLNPNGGTVNPNYKQIGFNDVYGNLPTSTKGDSKFLGWYTAITGGEKIESTTVMNTANNHTLYAHWKDPYTDNTGASRPVLKDELIPVTIAANGTVTKADIYEEWYDYNNKEWANAVILLDKAINYNEGETMPESNIESYFVWIPRYKYKIFNTGNYNSLTSVEKREQMIEVQFEDKNTTPSNGTTVGSWLTHPAFRAFDSNGFWVGKFESGYKGAISKTGAEVNSSDSEKLIVKPNTYSWRNLTLGNMFKVSYDYKRSLESHMMKNTEWGAAAFLQHSKYGSSRDVRFNNNNSDLTGYAAVNEPTCYNNGGQNSSCNLAGTSADLTQPYNTVIGYLASTTANISGIYDMAGGTWEHVMGYNLSSNSSSNLSGITSLYTDFFTNNKWNKYYDKYTISSDTSYSSRILGDATGEMGPFGTISGSDMRQGSWYGDFYDLSLLSKPWLGRGGDWANGRGSGIFQESGYTGANATFTTFRVVLTP